MTIQPVSGQPTSASATQAGGLSQKATEAGNASSAPQSQNGTTTQQSASPASYTVKIISAARAALAEAAETSVQTAQEASKGDQQAQRLLARERANKIA